MQQYKEYNKTEKVFYWLGTFSMLSSVMFLFLGMPRVEVFFLAMMVLCFLDLSIRFGNRKLGELILLVNERKTETGN